MQFSLLSLFVLVFLNVAFGAPIPVQEDLEQRDSGSNAQEPVYMHIRKHTLPPEEEFTASSTPANAQKPVYMHIRKHTLPEEEEFMRREAVDASHFRVGIVVRN